MKLTVFGFQRTTFGGELIILQVTKKVKLSTLEHGTMAE